MKSDWKPTSPTHQIKIRRKKGSCVPAIVGRAWLDPVENSMSIQLNLGVVLSWNDEVYIVAFPIEQKPKVE